MTTTYVSEVDRFVEDSFRPAGVPFTVDKKFDKMPALTKEVKSGKSAEQLKAEAAEFEAAQASQDELDEYSHTTTIPDAELSPQQKAANTRKAKKLAAEQAAAEQAAAEQSFIEPESL